MGKNYLKTYSLDSDEDKKLYRSILARINKKNPFFKVELLQISDIYVKQVKFFVFYFNDMPVILMNFILRKIEHTDYNDVISPYGYNGPIFEENLNHLLIIEFWQKVDQWYSNNHVVSEFIRFSLNNNHANYSGTTVHTLNNVRGAILNEETQWTNFKPKVRNNYRKAEKNKLTFKIFHKDIDGKVLDFFHHIYTTTMKRNTASEQYFYSREYFERYTRNNSDHCAIAIVFYNKIPISVELILLSEKTVYSFLGGTLAEHFAKRPNDYLKINILNWARKKEFKYYVLGGGREDGDSLYAYKKTFFSKDVDISYYTGRKIIDQKAYVALIKEKNMEMDDDITTGFFPKYRSVI